MLCSNRIDYSKLQHVIVLLVIIFNIPHIWAGNDQIVALRRTDDGQSRNGSSTMQKQVPFEEYFIEHNVSHRDAKKIFYEIGIKSLDKPLPSWCKECTDKITNYCLGGKVLDDHCCCDSRHGKEQLPWIPHTCYVGDSGCRPSVGSCITYTEYRECCCDRLLAKRYNTIYSTSGRKSVDQFVVLICTIVLVVCSLQ